MKKKFSTLRKEFKTLLSKLELTPEEREELKEYVDKDGIPFTILLFWCTDRIGPDLLKQLDKIIDNYPTRRRKNLQIHTRQTRSRRSN